MAEDFVSKRLDIFGEDIVSAFEECEDSGGADECETSTSGCSVGDERWRRLFHLALGSE